MLNKYSQYIKEGLKSLDDDPKKPIAISTWTRLNYDEFLKELKNELDKLVGKEIYAEVERRYNGREEKDPVYRDTNGRVIKPIVKIKVKAITTYGTNHKTLIVTAEDDKRYQVYKIVSKKEFDKFHEKIVKEKEKQDFLKNSIGSTIYFYGYRLFEPRRIPTAEERKEDRPYIVDGKEIKTVYKVDVKKIEPNRYGRRFEVTDENDKRYSITKVLDKKAYDRFLKRIRPELARREEVKKKREEFKEKMRDIDPYGEETWFEDNTPPGKKRYDRWGHPIEDDWY